MSWWQIEVKIVQIQSVRALLSFWSDSPPVPSTDTSVWYKIKWEPKSISCIEPKYRIEGGDYEKKAFTSLLSCLVYLSTADSTTPKLMSCTHSSLFSSTPALAGKQPCVCVCAHTKQVPLSLHTSLWCDRTVTAWLLSRKACQVTVFSTVRQRSCMGCCRQSAHRVRSSGMAQR